MDPVVDYVTNALYHCVCSIQIPLGKTHTASMGIHIQQRSFLTITANGHMGFGRQWRPFNFKLHVRLTFQTHLSNA